MIRRMVLCFVFVFALQSQVCYSRPLQYSVDEGQVRLAVELPQDVGYRVWYTRSPMRIIVDFDASLFAASSQSVSDTVLQTIRTAARPDHPGTRLVMDFRYYLPDFHWFEEDGHLHIAVDKVFVERTVNTISQGVRYGHERRGIVAGPLIVNFLEIDITNPEIELRAVLAQDQVFGSERVSSMAGRTDAIVAVNGLYFAPDGRPLGLLAIGGELVSEPYANRTAIGLGPHEAVIDSVGHTGQVTRADGHSWDIAGMNRPRGADELIVYTPAYGARTRTNVYGVDIVVADGMVQEVVGGNAEIPGDGVVLSGHGAARDFLLEVFAGEAIAWDIVLDPPWLDGTISEIIGGGPRLVKDGEVHITGREERFQPDILVGRAPRTAVGLTANGRLLLVTVNGRSTGISIGMTLVELAELMIELGAVDALNLDGGGSTTMVIRNRVLNIPSDGVERPVSNALVVTNPESRR